MRDLAWQTIKARKAGFVGAFLAVLCGTAVVAACGMLMESGISSGVPTQRYAAASVVAGGNQTVKPPGSEALESQQVTEQPPLAASAANRIAGVPGVRAAIGEVTFPANVVTGSGPLTGPGGTPSLGHNWASSELAPFALRAGAPPSAPDEVVLDAELARRAGVSVGARVRLATTGGPAPFRVSGIAAPPGADGFSRQSAVFFSDARANELFGRPGQVSAIGVLAADRTDAGDLADRIEETLGAEQVSVTTGVDRSTVEFRDVGQTRGMLIAISGSFGGTVLMVTLFVVSGTLALAIEQRRREFALLRAIAATPKQIRKLIGVETTLVAAIAAALGSVAGIAVAQGLRAAFAAIGVVPADFALTIGPLPLAIAFVLGLGAARAGAWTAGRRPSKISPVEALGEASVERRALGKARAIAGGVFLALGVGASTVPLFLHSQIAGALSGVAALLFVIGLALLGPKVVALAVRVIAGPLSRLSRVGGYLAAANTSANTRRMAAAVTPLMLAVGFAITNFFSQATTTAAVQDETRLATTADHVLTSSTGRLSPEVAEAARRIPGVAAATSVVRTNIIVAKAEGNGKAVEKKPVQGVDGGQARGPLDFGAVQGNFADLRGDAVALSASEASWLDKKIGDRVDFHFGDGAPANLRLVATYERDFAFGDYVLPAALARAHTTDRMDSSVLVRLAPGGDAAALGVLAERYPGLVVNGREAVRAADRSDASIQFWVNLVAIGVILAYIAISVGNTLVMTTAQRRREFALLRLVGTTRGQVRRMMRAEAFVVTGIAIVVGSLIPVLPLTMLSIGFTGTPVPSGPVAVYLGIIGAAALLGLLSLAIPTRLGLRARPIDAIGLRE
ncbi:ABC transporter permease [Amycolatopsis minnesotensis]|uniref:ABC transporter permease n=1 Tax=Amycolatopsis minnesotensis TaxID=337894 RepID=A0ABP5E600_9PSEU